MAALPLPGLKHMHVFRVCCGASHTCAFYQIRAIKLQSFVLKEILIERDVLGFQSVHGFAEVCVRVLISSSALW
jgi:hypothetical protein